MSRLASIGARAVHQPVTLAIYNQLKQDTDWDYVAGAALASLTAGNTLNVTSRYHQVTVATTTIDNIADAAGASTGQELVIECTSAQTVRNNGGGTGNIRTVTGADRSVLANEMVRFVFDGSVWREANARPAATTVVLLGLAAVLNGTVSYTAPVGATVLDVEAVAGGGAGGGVPATSTNFAVGGGGGGGGMAWGLLAANIGTHTVAVGAGGTGGAGSTGNSGGATSFNDSVGSTVFASTGGTGGQAGVAGTTGSFTSGGAGGGITAGSTGTGGGGTAGMNGGTLAFSLSGQGGGSFLAEAGGVSRNGSAGAGNAGAGFGSGGGGALGGPSTASAAGGNGANGILIVRAYR